MRQLKQFTMNTGIHTLIRKLTAHFIIQLLFTYQILEKISKEVVLYLSMEIPRIKHFLVLNQRKEESLDSHQERKILITLKRLHQEQDML